MDNLTRPHRLALIAMGVLGGTAGYLLFLALAGGRYEMVDQCYAQANGLTMCFDSILRPYWVDVTAAGIGALVTLVATHVVARRPGTPEGSAVA